MLVAVTGATGFLGRYILRRLADDGHRMKCWYRDEARCAGLDLPIEWMPGGLGDEGCTQRVVEGVDAVVHAALEWPTRRSDTGHSDLLRFAQTNLMGSLQLMDAAKRGGVSRFIFISTCAVHDRILDDRALDEAHPLWPFGHYGAHKAAVEKFVHSFGFGRNWNVCALRPTGIYGVAEPLERSKWFELVGRVVRGEAIARAAGGKEVHAADVAKAVSILLNAEASQTRGQAFNCYDMYISEQRVAEIARELCGGENVIEPLNKGPKHQIETGKIRALGMTFGGEPLLRETVRRLVAAHPSR